MICKRKWHQKYRYFVNEGKKHGNPNQIFIGKIGGTLQKKHKFQQLRQINHLSKLTIISYEPTRKFTMIAIPTIIIKKMASVSPIHTGMHV